MERSKDPMLKARTTVRGKNSKGGDRLQIYLDPNEVATLIQELQANADAPKGVKFDIHTSKKESSDGRQFDSTIFFVKAVAEGRGASPGGGGQKFVARKVNQDGVAEKIAALKSKQVG